MLVIGILIGFIAMIFLNFIPILGPILAGFIAGVIAGGGAGRGSSAGFFAGILGAVIVAILVTSGFGFFGSLFDMPLIGTLLGGAIGSIIIVLGLYNGFLGLIGGAIGGAVRGKRGRSEPVITSQHVDRVQHIHAPENTVVAKPVSSQTDTQTMSKLRAQRKCILNLEVRGNGILVPITGTHEYNEGAIVYINANPDEGWQFIGWIGEVKDPYSVETSIIMNADKKVTANFQKLDMEGG